MKIALAGNQNSGKTTLFNLLTGSNQKIGNWPGVTIEQKRGTIIGTDFELIDLPGIYSLSPYTAEEEISRRFLLAEKPDLVINIVDSTSIERSLYLTTQLMELDLDVIIALNMTDIMEKKGVHIHVDKLEKELGLSIVAISALKQTGINELITLIKTKGYKKNYHPLIFSADLENAIAKVAQYVKGNHKRFISVKLLERDPLFDNHQIPSFEVAINQLEKAFGTDIEEAVANQRYEYIVGIIKKAVTVRDVGITTTDKLDRIFLNKWLALPIFVVIMFLVYYLAVGVVGSFTVDLVDGAFAALSDWTRNALAKIDTSEWLISLIVDGIIAGVGAVLNFVPQLIILFLLIAVLETTGYMSRIAFFLDRLFRRLGLSGKSLIPFIVGSGCSVPGVMATRTIEGDKERRMSIILTPFIPCSAKLPIMALFASYFFPDHSGLVSASLYFMAIIVIVISAIIMKFFFKGNLSPYISELPNYKWPHFRYVFRDVRDRSLSFIKRAGTIILVSSVAVWFLVSFSWGFEYGVPVDDSILASVGNLFSWVFYPMLGELSWGATVSAFQGLVAKEQVVSSMAIIAGLAGDVSEGSMIFGAGGPFAFFTASSALAFVVFNLFSAPCIATIGAMKQELRSTKQMLLAISYQIAFAWLLGVLVYWVGNLIGVLV